MNNINSEIESYRFKNDELYEVWINKKISTLSKKSAIKQFILSKIKKSSSLSDKIDKIVLNITKNLNLKWVNSKCSNVNFRIKNKKWLASETVIKDDKAPKRSGRPVLNFTDKSYRSKRREASSLCQKTKHETELMEMAASTSARKTKRVDLSVVLKESIQSPQSASKIRKVMTKVENKPTSFCKNEALAFLLDNNFTKQQYLNILHESKIRNGNIYPPYKEVALTKNECRPDGIMVTEKFAKVSLKSLLQHTTSRIFELQNDVVTTVPDLFENNILNATLILSYGFDSSSGHSTFNQKYSDSGTSRDLDSFLLATVVNPLRLTSKYGMIIWNNRTPQSVRFCRPLKLEYIKETKETIIQEELSLRKEVEALEPYTFKINENLSVSVKFQLCLTLIDGRVLNALTDTKSTQSCPICGATPKNFKNCKNFKSKLFQPKEGSLRFGISPLHCWIRLFEFVVHAGYKLHLEMWQVRGDRNKNLLKSRKEEMQAMFWEEMSLQVDKPKGGGSGNTNNGNTARRAFEDDILFSKITGVDLELIRNLKIILICLSCQLPLNLNKFENFCFKTADIILKKYEWLPMTPTVHKVLVHSKQIMENSVLPVGFLGEDASESRHKIYKSERIHHSRKSSRINNLTDIFNRAMDSSDPLISSISLGKRIKQANKAKLPAEVIDLLSCDVDENSPTFLSVKEPKPVSDEEKSESESEDEDNSEYGEECLSDLFPLNENLLEQLELENLESVL